jgi:hypothetical protein
MPAPSNSPKRGRFGSSWNTGFRKLRILVTFQRGRRDVGRVLSPARVATEPAITVARLALFELASFAKCGSNRILIFYSRNANHETD